jgi:hypothetical protein
MSLSVAASLVLREGDRPRLEGMLRSSSIRAGLAFRAGTCCWPSTGCRTRRSRGGPLPAGSADLRWRPPEIDEIDVVVATLTDDGRPRGHLGVAHWSVRLLGVQLGISFASVARIWRKAEAAAVADRDVHRLH